MRALIAAALAALALWLAAIDWQATIGEGYAYRLRSLGAVLEGYWPATHARLVEGWAARGLGWETVGVRLMAVPAALLPAGLALLLWFGRRRRRGRA